MSDPIATQAPPPAILFVDDEATAVKYFQRAIGQLAPVVTGASVEEGKALLDAHADSLAVLISDQRMPGEFGNELLRYARERYPHIVRILTTAYSELEQTVEAVNQGQIHRYIRKPWDITALRMELKQALELAGLRKERDQLVREKLVVLRSRPPLRAWAWSMPCAPACSVPAVSSRWRPTWPVRCWAARAISSRTGC